MVLDDCDLISDLQNNDLVSRWIEYAEYAHDFGY